MVADKQLIILGNGFDLTNQFETTYANFINWIISQNDITISEIEEQLEDRNIHNIHDKIRTSVISENPIKLELPKMYDINIWYLIFIHSKLSTDANWNDVERQMYKYLIDEKILTEATYGVSSRTRTLQKVMEIILFQKEIAHFEQKEKLVNFFEKSLHELERDFERFLFEKSRYGSLNPQITCFGEYGPNKLLKYIAHEDTGNLPFNLLSFNYTDAWSKRWIDQRLITEEGGENKFVFPEKFLMVHGQAIYRKDNVNRLIFGIDHTKVQVDDVCYRFTKNFRTLILNSSKPMQNINNIYEENINRIKFFGHSLCEADYSYFQQMFDFYELYSNNNLKLYFYFNNWLDSGMTDAELLHKNVEAITNLIETYGQTLDNKDHGKNLLTRLQQTGRIVIKQIEPMRCI
ncbi:AbiH family protein [Lactococcus formosensis]|uniref:Bacteriophage abortive infection AbiH family protein n=1 Tax=Lactococcus formosensis TaxID=1281486 RepID=A0A9Q8Y0Z2_9LACT|nr:AbiH family protein [Lactococcus formosensis]USJ19906.1 bacteriophage abortive infection AbiH family protein [Lactococcus formosensis]